MLYSQSYCCSAYKCWIKEQHVLDFWSAVIRFRLGWGEKHVAGSNFALRWFYVFLFVNWDVSPRSLAPLHSNYWSSGTLGIQGCTCISTLIQVKDVLLKGVPSHPCLLHFGSCHSVIRESVNFSFWEKLKLEGALQLSVGVLSLHKSYYGIYIQKHVQCGFWVLSNCFFFRVAAWSVCSC